MRLVPVFIPETRNQTNYKCLSKLVQTGNSSLVQKTARTNYYTERIIRLLVVHCDNFKPKEKAWVLNCTEAIIHVKERINGKRWQ